MLGTRPGPALAPPCAPLACPSPPLPTPTGGRPPPERRALLFLPSPPCPAPPHPPMLAAGPAGDPQPTPTQPPPRPPNPCWLQTLVERSGSGRNTRAVLSYYLRQNELIDSLLETQRIHRGQYTNDGDAVGAGTVWVRCGCVRGARGVWGGRAFSVLFCAFLPAHLLCSV